MLSLARTEANFYFFIYKMKAAILTKNTVTVKKNYIAKTLFNYTFLGIRRTNDQIGNKKYLHSNGSSSEDIISFAYKSYLQSETAVFYVTATMLATKIQQQQNHF